MSFKRKDVQNCIACGKGIAHDWLQPVFYRVSLECFILDNRAIQQEGGLEQFFGGGQGGAALANIMGTDPDLATSPGKPIKTFLVCGDCAGSEFVEDEEQDPEQPFLSIAKMKTKAWDREDEKAQDKAG